MPLQTQITAVDVAWLKQLRDAHYAKPHDMAPWMEYRDAVIDFADVLVEAADFVVADFATVSFDPPAIQKELNCADL